MAFLNTADIGVCTLLESNYATIRDEYSSFKTEYLYNESREELDEDDSTNWSLWMKGNEDSLGAAKGLSEYQDFEWQEHTIQPIRKRCNWYGLTVDENNIWDGILLGSRSTRNFTSTILGSTYFPQTMELISNFRESIILSTTVAIFPANKIIPRHNGYATITRIHLPLYVPSGDIGFSVGEETRSWKTGKCLAFNDIDEHNAWNNTNKDRVALIVDIIRK